MLVLAFNAKKMRIMEDSHDRGNHWYICINSSGVFLLLLFMFFDVVY